jgi:hypothetical protein
MARTRTELAARLREGYDANNFAPVLEVIAELEAPEPTPMARAPASAVEAESCGDPVLGKAAIGEAVEVEEHDEPEAEDEDAPFGGGASGYPDRAHEDGEESPGLHHRTRTPKRPVRRRK